MSNINEDLGTLELDKAINIVVSHTLRDRGVF